MHLYAYAVRVHTPVAETFFEHTYECSYSFTASLHREKRKNEIRVLDLGREPRILMEGDSLFILSTCFPVKSHVVRLLHIHGF